MKPTADGRPRTADRRPQTLDENKADWVAEGWYNAEKQDIELGIRRFSGPWSAVRGRLSGGQAVNNPRSFDFDSVVASHAPQAVAGGAVKRAKFDFAVAYPDPGSLPLSDLADVLRQALMEEGRDLAVYPHVQGYPPLREYVADKLARDRGFVTDPDDIILTDGSGQANHMILEALIDPGDVVLTEEFVYSGTLRQLNRFRADIRGVACDDEGMLPDALEAAVSTASDRASVPSSYTRSPRSRTPSALRRRRNDAERCSGWRRSTAYRFWRTTATWTCDSTASLRLRSDRWTTAGA